MVLPLSAMNPVCMESVRASGCCSLLPVEVSADSHMELGSRYMEALCQFFGIDQYNCVYADGIDVQELDGEKILEAAIEETAHISRMLN